MFPAPFNAPVPRERGAKRMKRDAKRIGRADDEVQVSAAEQVFGTDAADPTSAAQKSDLDAEWLSMTTGDPALYLKDTE